MALDLGELSGTISLDDGGFRRTIQTATRGMSTLERQVGSSLDQVESEFRSAGSSMESSVRRAMDGVQDAAEDGGRRAGRAAGDELADGVEDGADRAGRTAGQGLLARLRRALGRTRQVGQEAGEDAGEGLGDGADRQASGRMSGLSGKLSGLMAKAGPWLAAGAAIGGFIMAGVAGAMEKQNAVAKLKAQVGAFGKDGERLGKVAGKLYADAYGESMADVTEALRAVVQNMDGFRNASQAALKRVSADAMNLSEIMGEDVTAVTRAAGQMMRTGLAKNAKEAFDVLTIGFQQGADKAEDLLDTFNEYSTQFRDLGLNAKSATGLMIQGLRAGARDADTVADGLKELNIRVQDLSAAPALKKLGLDADRMAAAFGKGGSTAARALDQILDKLRAVKDPTERYALAVQLLGTKSEDMAKALLGLDPSSAVKALGQVEGAAKRAGDTLHDTAQNRITTFTRTVKSKLTDFLGGPVLGGLSSFAGRAKKVFNDWLGDNADVVAKFKGVWDKVKGLFGRVVGDIKKWLDENKGDIQGWGDKIATAAKGVATAFNGALTIAEKVWDLFGKRIFGVIKTFGGMVVGYWSGIIQAIGGVWDIFAGIFTGDWKRVWDGLKNVVGGLGNSLKSVVKGIFNGILSAVGISWDGIFNTVKNKTEGIRNHVSKIFNSIKTVISNAWNAVKTTFSVVWNVIKALFTGNLDDVKAAIRNGVQRIKTSWKGLGDSLKSLARALWSAVKAAFRNGMDNLKGLVRAGISGIKTMWSAGWNNVKSLAKNAMSSLRNAVSSGIDKVIDFHAKLPGRILNALGNLGGLLRDAGAAIIRGLLDGINSMVGKVLDKLRWLTDKIPEWKGPASKDRKLLYKVGQLIMRGLADGMGDSVDQIRDKAAWITEQIRKAFAGRKTTLDDRLLAALKASTKKLIGLAREREKVMARIAEARQFAADVTGNARSFAGLTSLRFEDAQGNQTAPTAAGIRSGLASKLSTLKSFLANIKGLAKRGLPKSLLRQIMEAGPEEGNALASALMAADSATFSGIAGIQKEIDAASKSLGLTSADILYDSGRGAGRGFLTGLMDQQANIERQMDKIADRFARKIAKAFDLPQLRAQRTDGGTPKAALVVENYHEAPGSSARQNAHELLLLTTARG